MKGLLAWLLACLFVVSVAAGCSDPDAGPPLGDFPAINKAETDAPFTLAAPSSRSPAPFTFTSSNPAVATIEGATVTIRGAGQSTITASQPGKGSYGPTEKSTLLTVTPVACQPGSERVDGSCQPAVACVGPATQVDGQCVAPDVATVTNGDLIWTSVSAANTWADASNFCTRSIINGVGGWRQPSTAELAALVAAGSVAAGWAQGEAWTGDAVSGGASHVVVNLQTGAVGERPDTGSAYTSCVLSR